MKKYPPVEILRYPNRTTVVKDFVDICNKLNRETDFVCDYIRTCMHENNNLTLSNNSLIIGTYINNQVLFDIIKKYIDIYCMCSQCGNILTLLIKEDKIVYIQCNSCGSRKPLSNK